MKWHHLSVFFCALLMFWVTEVLLEAAVCKYIVIITAPLQVTIFNLLIIKGSRHRHSLCSEQCEQSGLSKIKLKKKKS